MARFNDMSGVQLADNMAAARKIVEEPLAVGRVPELQTLAISEVLGTMAPGEQCRMWQIQTEDGNWRALPELQYYISSNRLYSAPRMSEQQSLDPRSGPQ